MIFWPMFLLLTMFFHHIQKENPDHLTGLLSKPLSKLLEVQEEISGCPTKTVNFHTKKISLENI